MRVESNLNGESEKLTVRIALLTILNMETKHSHYKCQEYTIEIEYYTFGMASDMMTSQYDAIFFSISILHVVL